jgi:uncharacterized protein YcaQ
MSEEALSAREARRIALAAQGFASRRQNGRVGRARFEDMVHRLGVVQLDSVNVLVRSHYLPALSRLGAYDVGLLERAAWGKRPSLFEYWGHEASLMPLAMQPLFRWRMERARSGETWSGLATFGRERRDFIDGVLRRIEAEGPLTGGDFAEGPSKSGWWNWSDGKRALEWLFWAGFITTRTRRGFERVYDLTERVIPGVVLDTPTPHEADARRALLLIAANALGVATAADLRDYFRLPASGISQLLEDLVDAGQLTRLAVDGWRQPAYWAKTAREPRRLDANALLSPFDNLIWRRDRAERLFGTRIRLEIYTPAHKREHGYYVLPFVHGDSIVARVDLKADRREGALRIQASHLEPGADEASTAPALAKAMGEMAVWLGLSRLIVVEKGGLSAALKHALP